MRDLIVNLLALAGAVLVTYGLWVAYPPAGIVAAGVALILAAVVIARADEYRKRSAR